MRDGHRSRGLLHRGDAVAGPRGAHRPPARAALPGGGGDQRILYHHFGSWDAFVDALLAHWETTETHRLVEIAAREPEPQGRLDVLKHLALTFPHEAEAAIRAWAHGDARVAEVQRRVDVERRRSVAATLGAVESDPARRDRLAALALAVLVGQQQLLAPVDVGELLGLFDELVVRVGPARP